MKYCFKCLGIWNEPGQPGPKKSCTKCLADLHVCMNCRFYNVNKSNQCEVNDIEAIVDKEKANFCDDFQFADRPLPLKNNKSNDAKEAFEKLFKKRNER